MNLGAATLNARRPPFYPQPLFFRYYLLALTIVPVLFYIPKFFEVRTQDFIIKQQGSDSLSNIQVYLIFSPCEARHSSCNANISDLSKLEFWAKFSKCLGFVK